MIKKLQKKFIVITMLSVFAILTAILVSVNLANYFSVTHSVDSILSLLAKNNGEFPATEVREPNKSEDKQMPPPDQEDEEYDKNYILPEGMSQETPFDTRFFTVTLSDTGSLVNRDRIASVTEDEAKSLAEKVLEKGTEKGTIGNYRYLLVEEEDTKVVFFIDFSKQLEPTKNFLKFSLILSAVGLVIVFVIVLLISRPVVRPVAESYSRQKRFITDAGHELKTPLTIISANNEIIEMEQGESDYTIAIAKQVTRMTGMVKAMTELAKMDENETNFSVFSLTDAFIDTANCFLPSFEKDDKDFRIQADENIKIKGSESLIRRLVSLLIENAVKYSATFATATLKKSGSECVLTVYNDTSCPLGKDLSKCFERFYRSDEARASGIEGSGIGLSTAQEIVRIHKGKISVRNINGCFEIKAVFKTQF